MDGKISLTQMDEDGDLKNWVRVQMNQLDLVVAEKAAKEFIGGETKSTLEEGSQHHGFVGAESGDIFILSWSPLKDGTGREKWWFSTILRSLPSSMVEGRNIFGWEAAKARKVKVWAQSVSWEQRKKKMMEVESMPGFGNEH
jgi:hypothetical protein